MSRPVEPPEDAGSTAEAGRLANALHACLIPLVFHLPWRELAAQTQALLDQGADPAAPCTVTGRLRYSVLHELVRNPCAIGAFKALLPHASTPDPISGMLRQTPLHQAMATRTGLRHVLALLNKGADPNLICARGYPPLLTAIRIGHPVYVAALLRAGADAQGRFGGHRYSLLHEVASHSGPGTPEMHANAGLLLAHGADPEGPLLLNGESRLFTRHHSFSRWLAEEAGPEGQRSIEQARRLEEDHRLKRTIPPSPREKPSRPRM